MKADCRLNNLKVNQLAENHKSKLFTIKKILSWVMVPRFRKNGVHDPFSQ